MRRGLGTTDADEAERLTAEMNSILSDSSWWSAAKRSEAERTFSAPITAAFYNEIQAGRPDPWTVRDEHINLPSAEDDYARVLFVGTTGAGKTSLLRHVIGSDPDEDRFPSTSTAKTTVSDIEVVLAEGRYDAVITFFSEFWVQANVEECIADSCSAVWDGATDAKIAERLLNHRDQRFRLNYTLGSWNTQSSEIEEDDWAFESNPVSAATDEAGLDNDERQENARVLRDYLDRIKLISDRVIGVISKELDDNVLSLTDIPVSVPVPFRDYLRDNALGEHAFIDPEIDIRACRINSDSPVKTLDEFRRILKLISDHGRSLVKCFRENEAGKSIITEFELRRDLNKTFDLSLIKACTIT